LTDADGENQEVLHWLRTALACGYIAEEAACQLAESAATVGKQLGAMMNSHESFCFGEKR
jgi:four helix bundle protein